VKKTVTVRYFAAFREHAGIDEETIDVDVSTARDIFTQCQHRHGSTEPLGHCKVAINNDLADWDSPVSDGDTVLLFPPVAGG
jgi:molybdopterin synthase sulfur carrier subunit